MTNTSKEGIDSIQYPAFFGFVAKGRDGTIAVDGKIPWNLPDDLKDFKKQTLQCKYVVMGRKTWESLPDRKLPGRTCFVMSRQGPVKGDCISVSSAEDLIEKVKRMCYIAGIADQPSIAVIGGAQIYKLFEDYMDLWFVTEVDYEAPLGDSKVTKFPVEITNTNWFYRPEDNRKYSSEDTDNSHSFETVTFIRIL